MGKHSRTAKRLADSPGSAPQYACRGMAVIDMVGGSAAGRNVATAVDNGVGDWTVVWDLDMPGLPGMSTVGVVTVQTGHSTPPGSALNARVRTDLSDAGQTRVQVWVTSALADLAQLIVTVY